MRAAYYWKTSLRWEEADDSLARSLGLNTLYVRYFDVDVVDGVLLPVAPVRNLQAAPRALRIVPVVYITLDALRSIADSAVSGELADHIVKMSTRMHRSTGARLDELQIDCDWTVATRDRYFLLLRQIEARTGVAVSATIRLHQVKFARKTGVPPVGKGMLMVYNMGHPGKTGDRNSIIDASLVESYVDSLGSYPLPLDFAFPMFSWAVLFRGDSFVGLIRDIAERELEGSSLLRRDADHHWTVVKAGRLGNVQVLRGDRVRLDASASSKVLDAAAGVRRKARHPAGSAVALFSWDSLQIATFGHDNMEGIYATFD